MGFRPISHQSKKNRSVDLQRLDDRGQSRRQDEGNRQVKSMSFAYKVFELLKESLALGEHALAEGGSTCGTARSELAYTHMS